MVAREEEMKSARTERRRIRNTFESYLASAQQQVGPRVVIQEQSSSSLNISNNSVSLVSENSSNVDFGTEVSKFNHENLVEDLKLTDSLKLWYKKHNVNQNALSDLLKILKRTTTEGQNLPSDSRSFLKTPRSICVENKCGGEFVYFGILKSLNDLLTVSFLERNSYLMKSDLLFLTIGIDGLPISKSSRASFWPILGKLDQFNSNIFIIALFQGTEKPNNIHEFLGDLVEEIKVLQLSGIVVNNRTVKFSLNAIIADAPARSFIKQCKVFNSFHGCERCVTEGHYAGRVVYTDLKCKLRTKASFIDKHDVDHHTGDSPFLRIGFDLVRRVPLDYMHLVCLGVMRKLLFNWVFGKVPHKWNSNKVFGVSRKLISLKCFIPAEFSRKTRSLRDLRNYKATEYRLFLLYTGIVVLKNVITDFEYGLFLLLHCGVYILLSNNANNLEWNSYAKSCLEAFVKRYKEYYGPTFIVYNVHSLIHLADDSLIFGSLDNCSAFAFENYMQTLKSYIKKQNKQLVQVARRVFERNQIHNEECLTLSLEASTIKYVYKGIIISSRQGDNCFVTKSSEIVLIKEIEQANGIFTLKCNVLDRSSLEGYPCESGKLGIYLVKLDNDVVVTRCNDDLSRKCVLLPNSTLDFLCVPYCKLL